MRLKTPSTILMIINCVIQASTTAPEANWCQRRLRPEACRRRSARPTGEAVFTTIRISTAPVATTKLLIGPTTEVRMSSSTGFLKFRGSTGVGLAHPITGRCSEHRDRGQQQRPEQINVLDGIERNPPQHARGRIAAQVGHPGVRRFVDADRKHESDQLKHESGCRCVAGSCEIGFDTNTRSSGSARLGRSELARRKPCASAFPRSSAALPARSTLP